MVWRTQSHVQVSPLYVSPSIINVESNSLSPSIGATTKRHLKNAEEIYISGSRVRDDTESILTSSRTWWKGKEGLVSVEEYACFEVLIISLRHHTESRILSTIYGLLFWEMYFQHLAHLKLHIRQLHQISWTCHFFLHGGLLLRLEQKTQKMEMQGNWHGKYWRKKRSVAQFASAYIGLSPQVIYLKSLRYLNNTQFFNVAKTREVYQSQRAGYGLSHNFRRLQNCKRWGTGSNSLGHPYQKVQIC